MAMCTKVCVVYNSIPALIQIMAWSRLGAKPLSEPMMEGYWQIYMSLGPDELNVSHVITYFDIIYKRHFEGIQGF